MFSRQIAGLGALALALFAGAADAQTHTDSSGTVVPGEYDVSNATKALEYCQIIVTTAATSLSSLLSAAGCSPIPATATFAWITPESSGSGAVLRWRSDGTAPTASVGSPIQGWQAWPAQGLNELSAMSLISATGAAVTVDIQFKG
jgi:hypothetical protein